MNTYQKLISWSAFFTCLLTILAMVGVALAG